MVLSVIRCITGKWNIWWVKSLLGLALSLQPDNLIKADTLTSVVTRFEILQPDRIVIWINAH